MGQRYDSLAAMDMRDSLAWITGCKGHTDQSCDSLPAMYQTGHSLSNLHEMNPDALSPSHTAHSTSLSYSNSVPEIGQHGQSGLHSPTEEFCPLLAGQSFEYTLGLCDPDLAYLDFTSLPEIEDYTSVPLYYPEGSPIVLTLHRHLSQLTHQSKILCLSAHP